MKFKVLMLIFLIGMVDLEGMEKENDPIALNSLSKSKKRKLRRKKSYEKRLHKKQLAHAVLLHLFCPSYQSTQTPLNLWLPDLEPIDPEGEKEILFCNARSEFLPTTCDGNYDLLSMLDYDGWFIMNS